MTPTMVVPVFLARGIAMPRLPRTWLLRASTGRRQAGRVRVRTECDARERRPLRAVPPAQAAQVSVIPTAHRLRHRHEFWPVYRRVFSKLKPPSSRFSRTLATAAQVAGIACMANAQVRSARASETLAASSSFRAYVHTTDPGTERKSTVNSYGLNWVVNGVTNLRRERRRSLLRGFK